MAKTFSISKSSVHKLQARKEKLLKEMEVSPHLIRASYVRQFVTCGKLNCRCRNGFKHGPFYYLVQCRAGGNMRKFLLKTKEEREQVRAAIAAYTKHQEHLMELCEINMELLRRNIKLRR